MSEKIRMESNRNVSEKFTLQAMETSFRNVGYGIVRAHQVDMVHLGCSNGDIVQLEGNRKTVARIMVSEEGKQGFIEIDGIIRKNAEIVIGEQVYICKATYNYAQSVTIVPSARTKSLFQSETEQESYLSRILGKIRRKRQQKQGEDIRKYQYLVDGVPIVRGDRIRIHLFGRPFDFEILETVPEENVIFNHATQVSIVGGTILRAQHTAISYEDIGGLGKEISRVREMVELPLRYPQLFEQVGVEPPQGLLLYGPPGCGKTLIARTVAQEAGVHFISVNGPEIIQQHYGESEEKLRQIFEEAQEYSPAIIFFDEIDALAPSRDTVLGDVEKRVVAQLLTLMDGLRSRGRIIVIAATNLPNNVDQALRRPGRFDREIGINPPDKMGRLEILHIHTRRMPLADDVNMERVAAMAHGFLGADLAALCREAAMICIRERLNKSDFFSRSQLSEQETEDMKVGMKHFETALNESELSTTRQVSTEVSEVKWKDIGGLNEIINILREAVELPLKYSDRFEYAKIRPPKGILLTGASGTGKTLLAKALATESEVNFISVKGPELLSKWVGESERGIREIFKKARQSAPSIIFFDEIDTIVPVRGGGDGGSHIGERMVGQFLLEMDSIEDLQGVLILAATNRPDLIDKALFRPGRFDFIVELPIPDYQARLSILQVYCRDRTLGADVSLADVARITEGMTGAELEALCQRAAMLAIKESIAKHPEKQFSHFSIEKYHFDAALAVLSKNVNLA
jgi:transitional endoplasmic reticulum ATPase